MPELLASEDQAQVTTSAPVPGRRGRWRPDFRLGYALLIPVLLACATPANFLYDAAGWLDPNVYVGYFLHYSDHLPLFDTYYKISRLPWVLPGFAAYRLFGPMTASVVLPVATLTFGLACLYLLLRDALDARTGLLAVVLLGTCAWFHGVGGWNYHMTIATGYYLLTVLCMGRAAASPTPRRWHFLAGVALSLTVHTFIFSVTFVPGLVLHYFLTCGPEGRRPRRALSAALLALAGIAASTGVLGTINMATGGAFQFYVPQVNLIRGLAKNGNAWFRPVSVWLPRAACLVLPAAALVSCPLTWLFGKPGVEERTRSRALAIAGFQVQLVWAVLVCCYYQFVKHQTTLDYDYFAVCLLGPGVLALSGFIYAVRDGWSHWGPHRVFAVAMAVVAVPFLVNVHWDWVPLWVAPVVLPSVLALAGVLCLTLARKWAVAFVAGLALLGLSNADSRHHSAGRLNRDAFAFSIEADEFTTRLDPTLNDIKYWFDSKGLQPTTGIFHSFVSTRGWAGNMLGGAPNPPLAEIRAKDIGNFGRVAVLSNTADKEDWRRRVADRFADLGMPLQLQAERDFRHGEIEVSMAVYQIRKTKGP